MVRSSSLAAISANLSAATKRTSKSGKTAGGSAAAASPAASKAKPSNNRSKQLYQQCHQQWQTLAPQLNDVTDPAIVAAARQVGKEVFKLSEANTDELLQPELDELHLRIKDTLQYLAFASRTKLTMPKTDAGAQAKPFANNPQMLVADLRTNKKKRAPAPRGRPAAAQQSQVKQTTSRKRQAAKQSADAEHDGSDVDPFDEAMLTDAESEKENESQPARARSSKNTNSRKANAQQATVGKHTGKRTMPEEQDDGPALQSPPRTSLKNQTAIRSKRRRLNE